MISHSIRKKTISLFRSSFANDWDMKHNKNIQFQKYKSSKHKVQTLIWDLLEVRARQIRQICYTKNVQNRVFFNLTSIYSKTRHEKEIWQPNFFCDPMQIIEIF